MLYIPFGCASGNNFSINTISYAVNLINFIIITSIYYITKQRVCETISIIKMLTISKNLVWPRDLESFKGGKFNTLSLVANKKETKKTKKIKKNKKKLYTTVWFCI
jgi:hypothetical protein